MSDEQQNTPLQDDDELEFTADDFREVLTCMCDAFKAELDGSNHQSTDQ